MDKKSLSESDICDKCIRPAMERAGWHPLDQIYREFPLRAGRVVVRGKTARRDASTVLHADYALFYKPNLPLAVVEAKDNRPVTLPRLCAALHPPRNESPDTTSQLAQALVKNIAFLEL